MTEDSSLIPETRTNSSDGFTDARITHMNLYAVEALLARVYWTRGDLSNAAIYAQKVIDSKKFSFRPLSTFVQSDGGTLDLNETIFGFYSESSQSTNSKRYGITGTSATFSLASDWKVLYEDNAGDVADYRINSWFDNTENRLKKTVNSSVANGAGYSGKSIVGVNILRLPEMYYIMAEFYMTSNPRLASEFFNAVTKTRGIEPVQEGKLTYDILFNERRKEFYGEGFTWFEMKKLGKDIKTAAGQTLSGSVPGNYTIPIPEEEDESRKDMEI